MTTLPTSIVLEGADIEQGLQEHEVRHDFADVVSKIAAQSESSGHRRSLTCILPSMSAQPPPKPVQKERLAKSIARTHELFCQLRPHQQELFAFVTEDIPMNKNAGLQTVAKRLWNGREVSTTLEFIVIWGQLALNLFMSIISLQLVAKQGGSQDEIRVEGDTLVICNHRLSQAGNDSCVTTTSFPSTFRHVILLSEAAVTILLISLVVVRSFLFVMCKFCQVEAGESFSVQYFSFLALPRIACKFSFLMCLHLASAPRMSEIFLRGDMRCLFALWKASWARTGDFSGRVLSSSQMVAPCKENGDNYHSEDLSDNTCSEKWDPKRLGDFASAASLSKEVPAMDHALKTTVCSDVCTMIFCAALVILSFHLLLLKLTMLYFACLLSPYFTWTFKEYTIFFGFLNQLQGISLAREVETVRVLLFKFGGENARWTTEGMLACDAYFQFLAWQCIKQLGHLKSLMVLWTLDSTRLQNLFLGHARADEQKMVRPQHTLMFQHLNDKRTLEEFRDSLVSRFTDVMGSFKEKLEPIPKQDRLKMCNKLQRRGIGELRLAAKIQEFIWEWEKDEIHMTDKGG